MPIHLAFDLLAYASALVVGIWCRKTLFQNRKSPVGKEEKHMYYFVILNGVIWGAIVFGTLNLYFAGMVEHTNGFMLGKSILGAIVGGIIAVEIFKKLHGIRTSTGVFFVPSLAVGILVGRFGCFLAGLQDYTYGKETTLPWAYDFGDGILRHPVQLYEAGVMALFLFVFLYGMLHQKAYALKHGFYWFCIVYGTQRFLWEFLKPYPLILGPLNWFHLWSVALVLYGLFMIHHSKKHA